MSGNLGGQPPFMPTEDQRRLVRVLIAELLDIGRKTLRRHFRREIATGRETVRASLGTVLVREGLAGDWRAALAWLWITSPGHAGTPIAIPVRMKPL